MGNLFGKKKATRVTEQDRAAQTSECVCVCVLTETELCGCNEVFIDKFTQYF